MPFFPIQMGALPARFRQQRILIVGCGDVAMRLVKQRLPKHKRGVRIYALTRHTDADKLALLRTQAIVPIRADLDNAQSLKRFKGLAHRIVYTAPPARVGDADLARSAVTQQDATHTALRAACVHGYSQKLDRRMRAFASQMRRGATLPTAMTYISTSGVYGNRDGDWVSEVKAVKPQNLRAWRRLDAERQVRAMSALGVHVAILRAPGIYAADRANGTPLLRLQKKMPVLCTQDDVYTNHIHADDLARAAWLALWRVKGGRVFNVNDDTSLKMGDYFDWVAQLSGLEKPARITRAEAKLTFSEMQMSFMSESRRMNNARVLKELRMQLKYPTVLQGLRAHSA